MDDVYRYAISSGLLRVFKDGTIYKYYKNDGVYRKAPILRMGRDKKYLAVTFEHEEKQYHLYVHRLVGFAYIPNPDNKPQINHIDNNPENNNVKNLEWVTAQENIRHAIDNGHLDHMVNAKDCRYCHNLTRAKDGVCPECKYEIEQAEERIERVEKIRLDLDEIDIRCLNQRELKIVYKRYMGETYESIGSEFGVSRQAIEQLIQRLKNKKYKKPVYPYLEKYMDLAGIEDVDIAYALRISQVTANKKLSGKSEWKLSEAIAIKEFLSADLPVEILFSDSKVS